MTTARFARLVFLFTLLFIQGLCYEIPEVKIDIINPKGFKASIPHAENMTLFAFQGNVNKPISQTDVGQISGEVVEPKEGRWTVYDTNVKLEKGDVIRYYIFVSIDGLGYIKDGLSYVVGGGVAPPRAPEPVGVPYTISKVVTSNAVVPPVKSCERSLTTVKGKAACKGEVVFEEHFDAPLNDNTWLVEHKIPVDHLDLPFVSYQRSTVSVAHGHLRIQPIPQKDIPGYNEDSHHLDLTDGCTGSVCEIHSNGADIVPPVASGRVKCTFTFKYGMVEIRAKLPQGDWLYPEILLESHWKRYGVRGYQSGLMKLANCRGNRRLQTSDDVQYGNNVLEGGVVISEKCPNKRKFHKELTKNLWGDGFHTYAVIWTPDYIKFLADDEEVGYVSPPEGGIAKLFAEPGCDDLSKSYKTKMAPFDDEFMITLGVLAGGRTEFPDKFPDKPWKNMEPKAKFHFASAMDFWLPTWTDSSSLLVDFIKVTAL